MLKPLAIAVVLLMALAACSSETEQDVGLSGDDDQAAQSAQSDTSDTSAASGATGATGGSDTVAQSDVAQTASLPAAELRITLERLLSQHAILAIEAMRAGVTGADHFEAAAGSLQQNTDDLVGAVELVYGSEGADAFRQLWEDHIGFFVDYTVGVAEGDQAAQDQALTRLDQYRQDFGNFIESATGGGLTAGPVADLLQSHVDQLVSQIDSYANEDFEAAASKTREAYAHMFGTAKALAGAISGQFPDRFGGDLENQQIDLRSALGQLLGEHAQVAIQAMRAGVSGQDDFTAIAGALNENTEDLTDAISGIFGSEGGQAFNQLWSDHIDFFVQFTVGLAEGDQAAQDQALARLEQYRQDFSGFLSTATNGSVPADVVAAGLQEHVNQLVEQVEAFHEDDFQTAFSVASEGFAHMFMTAEALAGGITAFLGSELPQGGTETGGGGAVGR